MAEREIRFWEIYAGIGGFREGLTRASSRYLPVGYCEIDPYARKAYELLYEPKGERYDRDARAITPEELPDFDLLCGGFPCQSFSIAGARRAFADPRGTLFFEIARIAAVKRPSVLFLENVFGILSADGGRVFATILAKLDELGYDVAWQVKGSIAQFRWCNHAVRNSVRRYKNSQAVAELQARIFVKYGRIYASECANRKLRGAAFTAQIILSPKTGKECFLSDFLETDVPDRYWLSETQTQEICNMEAMRKALQI